MPKKQVKKIKICSFVRKLITILNFQKYSDVVAWLPEDGGFQILDVTKFTDLVLPEHFRHKNLTSFIRQLNMYGFIRPKNSDQYTYCHYRFKRNNLNSLRFIQRKPAPGESLNEPRSAQKQASKTSSEQDINIKQNCNSLEKENSQLKKTNEELQARLELLTSQFNMIKNLKARPIDCHDAWDEKTTRNQETSLLKRQNNFIIDPPGPSPFQFWVNFPLLVFPGYGRAEEEDGNRASYREIA